MIENYSDKMMKREATWTCNKCGYENVHKPKACPVCDNKELIFRDKVITKRA